MKKSSVLAVSAAALFAMASCETKNSTDVNLVSDIDSLSYSIGVLNFNPQMKNALTQQFNIDSTAFSAFVQGFMEGANSSNAKEKARALGYQMGMTMASDDAIERMGQYFFDGDSTKSMNKSAIVAGFADAFGGADQQLSLEEARAVMTDYQRKMNEAKMLKQYGDWKVENEKFLADNKAKEGVEATASGLQYKVIRKGNGAVPTDSTQLAVRYKGKLIDGTVFDESKDKAFECTPSGFVIEGWKEALKLFPAGSKVEIYVPQNLGYGAANRGKIKPFSTLIFEMEISEKK